jgi:hypothetical protein
MSNPMLDKHPGCIRRHTAIKNVSARSCEAGGGNPSKIRWWLDQMTTGKRMFEKV